MKPVLWFSCLLAIWLCVSCEKDSLTVEFSTSSNQAAVGETIKFRNETSDAETFEWHFGDGSSSTKEDDSHAYSNAGNYIVSLVAHKGKRVGIAYSVITVGSSSQATGSADVLLLELDNHSPVINCPVQLYTSAEDLEQSIHAVRENTTDLDGRVAFSNLPSGTYYVKAYKQSGTEVWDNSDCNHQITIEANANLQFTLYAIHTDASYAFRAVFTNSVFTTVEVTANGSTRMLGPGESATFNFTLNPLMFTYFAETQGSTSSGTPIGENVYWSYSDIDVSGLSEYPVNLITDINLFFLKIQNNCLFNLTPIEVYSLDYSYSMLENVLIPNDNVLYTMGYYMAYSDISIDAFYEGYTNSGANWENGFEFNLPMLSSQYVQLHTDDAWEFKRAHAAAEPHSLTFSATVGSIPIRADRKWVSHPGKTGQP